MFQHTMASPRQIINLNLLVFDEIFEHISLWGRGGVSNVGLTPNVTYYRVKHLSKFSWVFFHVKQALECAHVGHTQAKKKICEFTVTRPTLIFGPDPKGFYGTFNRELFQKSHFHFQTLFWILLGSLFWQEVSNCHLSVVKCALESILHEFLNKD